MKKWSTRNLILVVFAAALMLLSGCVSGQIMKPADLMSQPQTDEVLVTVVRPQTFVGAAISSSIWDSDNLVGVISGGQYVEYKTTPGKHLYLSRAENWSYLSAEFLPGKHYVVRADVFPGVWKARIALNTIDKSDPDYKETVDSWLKKLKPMQLDPEKGKEYAEKRLDEVKHAIQDFEDGKVKFSSLLPNDYVEIQ